VARPLSPSNKQNPLRLIADMPASKPQALMSCVSISAGELWIALSRCTMIVDRDTSPYSKQIKTIISPLGYLRERYAVDTWLRHKTSFLFQYTDKLYQRFSAVENTMSESEFQKLPGCRELTSLHWVVNAARNVLRHLYGRSEDLPDNITILNELNSLRDNLIARKHIIDCCVKDMACLQLCEDLSSVYHSEISLLIDMLRCGSDGNRTEDECVFALSKLCHRQVDLEARLMGRATSSSKDAPLLSSKPGSPVSTLNRGTPISKSRQKSSSNPLWLVMQNVFPSDDLTKTP
jgi:hypothetical protein